MVKNLKYKNKFKISLLIAFFALMIPIQSVFAGDGRYLAFLFDTDAYDIKTTSIIHETKNTERDLLGCLDPNNPYFSISQGAKEGGGCSSLGTGKDEENTIYTYPKGDKKVNGYDQQMVDWLGTELTNGINRALHLVSNYGDTKINSKEKLVSTSIELANCVASNAQATGEFSCLGLTMRMATDKDLEKAKITLKKEGPSAGSQANNYIIIKADGKENIMRYSAPVGYAEDQFLYLANSHNEQERATKWSAPSKFMTWSHVVYSAKEHYKNAVTMQDFSSITKKDGFTESFVGLIESGINGISSFLGLYSVEELTLNTGMRESYYYKGLMPYSWFKGINIIYWIMQVVAIFVIGASIINTVRKRQIATFNPSERASLKEDLMNLVYTIILLVAFIPIFYIMATFNVMIIDTLKTLVPEGAKLTTSMSSNAIVGLLVLGIYLFLVIRINITYLIRSVVLSVLYMGAPFFISCLSFGRKGKELFQNWMKELVANIFLQTCNAIMMVFFLLIVGVGTRGIERLILLYSFIPLNKWFKENLMDMKVGSDQTADTASKTFGAAATGAAAVGLSGVVAAFGNGNIMKAFGGDKKAMEGRSMRDVDDDASKVKDFNGFDKDSSSSFGKEDIKNYQYNANKSLAQTGMDAKELSPFDPKRLTGETIRTLGSAATATVAMGLSFGAGAAGYDGRAFSMIGAAAAMNTATLGKDVIHEGQDYMVQKQMSMPATEVRSSKYSSNDFNNGGYHFEQGNDGSISTMLDEKMIGEYSTQAFEKAQSNLKEGTLAGIYNDDHQVVGWTNSAFSGSSRINKNSAQFEQTVDNIFTPRDLDDELINKQLGDAEKMQQEMDAQKDRIRKIRNSKSNHF